MRTVIGEYESLAAAESAVRAMEQQMSIQNVVIGDQRARKWPRRDPERDHRLGRSRWPQFIVSMTGTAEGIEQARALLRAQVSG